MKKRTKLLSIVIVFLIGASALSILPHQAKSATSGLVGYWKFDEGSGTVAHDSSGNAISGTIYGALWTAGMSGNALHFDGANSYVEVPNSADLNPTAITLMAWVKFSGFPDFTIHPHNPNSHIVGKGTGPNNGYELRQDCGDTDEYGPPEFRFCMLENNVWYSVVSTTKLVTDEWYDVAATYDGSTMRLYVNGTLEDQETFNVAMLGNTNNLLIGALNQPPNEYRINGTIDEVKIYNRALTSDEVYNDYLGIEQSSFWTQWWFWTIVVLGILDILLVFTTLYYRRKALPKGTKTIPSRPAPKEYIACPKCGANLPADSKFCGKCGTSLE
jgi:hypothetical protein